MKNDGIAVLPMFYKQLEQLSPERHMGLGLSDRPNFTAAREANAVPLGVSEFALAARNYPIVFGPPGQSGVPVAITALVEGRNLFVNTDGSWESDAYIPAYLRRYPFWMVLENGGQQASLWFDPEAGYLVPLVDNPQARPLIDFRNESTPTLNEITQFCQQCFMDERATAPFLAALEESNLLISRHANIDLGNGKSYQLGGFRVVDIEAYHRLPDATLAQWVRNGWAALIGFHHWSVTHNWQPLLDLHQRRAQEPGWQ